jgi:hypothetical protein
LVVVGLDTARVETVAQDQLPAEAPLGALGDDDFLAVGGPPRPFGLDSEPVLSTVNSTEAGSGQVEVDDESIPVTVASIGMIGVRPAPEVSPARRSNSRNGSNRMSMVFLFWCRCGVVKEHRSTRFLTG